MEERRELTSTWRRSSLSARVHTRPAFLPPVPLSSSVVINRSEILPFFSLVAKELNAETDRRRINRDWNRDHHAFTHIPVLAFYASASRCRSCRCRNSVFLVISDDKNEMDAREAALCVCFVQWEGPDEPARGATYPTRGSELTERDPRARGCGQRVCSTWGADRRQHAKSRPGDLSRCSTRCSYRYWYNEGRAYLESDSALKRIVEKAKLAFFYDLIEISYAFKWIVSRIFYFNIEFVNNKIDVFTWKLCTVNYQKD